MLSDGEFYASINVYLRAKRTGQAEKVTPKDASATRSNGEKEPDGVTESMGPNGPILSIIVRSRGSQASASHQSGTVLGDGFRWLSTEHRGWAWPVIEADNIHSLVDGIVMLEGMPVDKVKIRECKIVENNSGVSETFSLFLVSLKNPENVRYVISFDGRYESDGSFRTNLPGLNDLAGDWAVRWMFREKHGR